MFSWFDFEDKTGNPSPQKNGRREATHWATERGTEAPQIAAPSPLRLVGAAGAAEVGLALAAAQRTAVLRPVLESSRGKSWSQVGWLGPPDFRG